MSNRASRKNRFLSPGWLMFGSALLCVLLVPVLHATLSYSSEKSERQKKLSELTKSDRLKIQHAFAEFQKLSPAEQESFRELDRRLNHEDIELKTTLDEYNAFLAGLSPVDRAEIDHASTQRERLSVIERIQEERANRRQQLQAGFTEQEEFRSNLADKFPVLSPAEMEAISAAIEERLPADARSKVGLDSYTGAARFAATIAAAFQAWSLPPEHAGWHRELKLDPALVTDIISAIHNEEIRKNLADSKDDKEERFKLVFLFYYSMRRSFYDAYPSAAELSKFMDAQDKAEKDRLNSMSPRIMYSELGRSYLEQSNHPIAQAFKQFPRGSAPNERWGGGGRSGRGGAEGKGPDGPGPGGPPGANRGQDGQGFPREDAGEPGNRGREGGSGFRRRQASENPTGSD